MTVAEMIRQSQSYAGEASSLRLDPTEIVAFLDDYYEKAIDRIPGHQLDQLFKRISTNLIANRDYYFEKTADFPDIIKLGVVRIYNPYVYNANQAKYCPAEIISNKRGVRPFYTGKYTPALPAAYLGYPTEQTPVAGRITQSVIIIPRPTYATSDGKGLLVDYVYDPPKLTYAQSGTVPLVPTQIHDIICKGAAADICARLKDYDGWKKNMSDWEKGMLDYIGPQIEPPVPDEITVEDMEEEMT